MDFLTSPDNAELYLLNGNLAEYDDGVVIILPSVSVVAASANEGSPVNVPIRISVLCAEDVLVGYTMVNGSAVSGTDYEAVTGTATVTAGTLEVLVPVVTTLRAGYQGVRSFVVTISNARTTTPASLAITTASATMQIVDTEIPTGAHGYFEALIARPDYWKGMSFRPIAGRPQVYASGTHAGKLDPYYGLQLAAPGDGGYANSNTNALDVTYAPGLDTDPHAQDAAKIVIACFGQSGAALTADLPIGETTLSLGAGDSYDNGTTFLINAELLTTLGPKTKAATTVQVTRGAFGSTEAHHVTGTTLRRSGSSLRNQVRLPLVTTPGQSYLFTYDTMHTDSYCRNAAIGETQGNWLKNHKAFQFTSKSTGGGNIWMEPATRFSPSGNAPSPAAGYDNTIHVYEADWRSYMTLSSATVFDPALPNQHPAEVTRGYPMRPMDTAFIVHPNRWTRFWIHFTFVLDDFDRLNVWIADEVQEPVQLFTNFPVKAWQPGVTNGTIREWWVELNTSDSEHFRLDLRDLVAYIRNFSAHTMALADVAPLLIKPA